MGYELPPSMGIGLYNSSRVIVHHFARSPYCRFKDFQLKYEKQLLQSSTNSFWVTLNERWGLSPRQRQSHRYGECPRYRLLDRCVISPSWFPCGDQVCCVPSLHPLRQVVMIFVIKVCVHQCLALITNRISSLSILSTFLTYLWGMVSRRVSDYSHNTIQVFEALAILKTNTRTWRMMNILWPSLWNNGWNLSCET